MGADFASERDPENNPDTNRDGDDVIEFNIPSPRPALDDEIEDLPKIGSSDPAWWYDQPRKRGNNRRYTGHVERISGAEGDRLRGNLAAIFRDLLDWATRHHETTSGEDDGADGADDKPS